MSMNQYEEGELTINTCIRRHWWQIWLPKKISVVYGRYTRIGDIVRIELPNFSVIHLHASECTLWPDQTIIDPS